VPESEITATERLLALDIAPTLKQKFLLEIVQHVDTKPLRPTSLSSRR
jgi:hypothetical protein